MLPPSRKGGLSPEGRARWAQVLEEARRAEGLGSAPLGLRRAPGYVLLRELRKSVHPPKTSAPATPSRWQRLSAVLLRRSTSVSGGGRLDASLVLASPTHSQDRMQYAPEKVNLAAFEALRRLRVLRPWVEAVARSSSRSLSPAEILCIREHLALEYGLERTPAGFLPIGVWDGESDIQGSGWPPSSEGSRLKKLAESFNYLINPFYRLYQFNSFFHSTNRRSFI